MTPPNTRIARWMLERTHRQLPQCDPTPAKQGALERRQSAKLPHHYRCAFPVA
jgi:hypothetical protein